MVIKKILIVLFLLATSPLSFGQNVDDIIQHYFDTVSGGNLDKWRNIKTVYIESTGYFNDSNLNISSETIPSLMKSKTNYSRVFREWPDKLKTELYEDSAHHILLGIHLWVKDKLVMTFRNMQPIIKKGNDLRWDFIPVVIYDLFKNSRSKQYKGIKNFENDGISCFDIELVNKDQTTNLYFNRDSYLLEYMKILDPSDSNNFTRYHQYKLVDGFLIATSVYGTRNGVISDAITMTKIVFNVPFEKREFELD